MELDRTRQTELGSWFTSSPPFGSSSEAARNRYERGGFRYFFLDSGGSQLNWATRLLQIAFLILAGWLRVGQATDENGSLDLNTYVKVFCLRRALLRVGIRTLTLARYYLRARWLQDTPSFVDGL